ncbi:sphingosine hydroxylase [Auricularia subglabra TFB-10046 SS5]|nr:sphingosine hydroxylase [Auricularia subglabra TFB-10046 SS5]
MNSSSLPFDVEELVPRPITLPFYHTPQASVLPFMSDITLSMVAPIVAYWAYSLFFHAMDTIDLLPAARIHTPDEIAKRNRATRTQVVTAVLFQQFIQFVTGYVWLSMEKPEARPSHADAMRSIAGPVARVILLVLGQENGLHVLRQYGPRIVEFVYWWGIPGAQLALGMFVMDTWQYFLHRAMHVNKFLYRHFHSVHHRLYVPYAYGALYNHPLEGFLLDTLGGALSELAAGMTLRQAAFFFTVSTMKTVDDHCGYRLLLDPFQFFFANTADYHDIHHQHAGIKYNFSQPFFIHWDDILGTRMRRDEFTAARKAKKLPEKEL